MQQPRSSKPRQVRGPKRTACFNGSRLRKAREAAELTQEDMVGTGLSLGSIQRAERGVPVSQDTALAICAKLNIDLKDYLAQEATPLILDVIPSDSRLITGDMIVLGGNYINGTPFAFQATMTLVALSAFSLISFECSLFRERDEVIYPPGKTYDDYEPDELFKLPTDTKRDYAWNRTPTRLGGAFGVFGIGGNNSPITVSNPMVIIDGQEIALQKDLKTLTKPYQMPKDQVVTTRYGRLCSPAGIDEAPADYIYNATIECCIGLISSDHPKITCLKWILDYSKGGSLSLRSRHPIVISTS